MDEAATADALVATMREISETTYANGGQPLRSVHAKGHAVLRGEFEVRADLPPALAQGLFAKPGRHPALMRISTIPGDMLEDSITVPRGFALKLIGVEGERLPGSEGDTTQDFVLAAGPTFAAPDGKSFLASLRLLAATTDRPQVFKKAVSATLRTVEATLEAVGGESGTLKRMGGQPLTNPLGDAYFSQAPILYGDYIAKVGLFPAAAKLTALKDAVLDASGHPDILREELVRFFADHGGRWELRVQLCTDLKSMPVEDASIAWPEERSPYLTVGHLTAPPQQSWSAEHETGIDAGLSFSPWHGLAAHRPLGSIMRLRKPAYRMSARFRSERLGCPLAEPRSADDIAALSAVGN
ncbi:catalase family protein [Bosea sp. BK604]|uniref:catalase family protein n=1 Tax=Bosea sp. BK604 TaxID=2512180 RepID=UPI001051ADE6|nr:catalase family protein [Bosea sp. BK604]TCR65702.1 catalase [Bosea sp. BK604]